MRKVSGQDRQTSDAVLARRKRIVERAGQILGLLVGPLCLLLLFAVVRIGYLSWIGITIATLLVASMVVAPVFGLAGRKRLEAISHAVHFGVIGLIVLAGVATLLWPEGNGAWRPYRFDDELARIEAERAVPDGENAAIRYNSVLATIDMNDRPDFVFDGDLFFHRELTKDPWKAEDYPLASKWLDSHAEVVRELLQIGQMEKCRWPVLADDGAEYTVPHKRLLQGVQLLLATANRDLGEGRIRQAIEKYACLQRQGDHLYQQTDQMDFMYGFHPEGDALHMIRHTLVASELSREDIEWIARSLPTAANTWRRDISNLLEFDKVRFARLMAWAYEINEQGKTRFAASFKPLTKNRQENSSRLARLWRLYWLMNMPLDPHGVWGMADREAADAARFLESGPMLPRDTEFSPSFRSYLDFAGKVLGSVPHLYAHMICTAKDRYMAFSRSYVEHMTHRRGTWLVLGLRRYRDAHGAWPDTLDSVSQYVPTEAFLDPMSADAFVYARDGDGFRLYSKGRNRIDEGGRHGYVRALRKVEDDIPLWPPPVPVAAPELIDEEEMKRQLKEIYGPGYVPEQPGGRTRN